MLIHVTVSDGFYIKEKKLSMSSEWVCGHENEKGRGEGEREREKERHT